MDQYIAAMFIQAPIAVFSGISLMLTDGRTDGQTDGDTDGWKDGWTYKRTNGQMHGRTKLLVVI